MQYINHVPILRSPGPPGFLFDECDPFTCGAAILRVFWLRLDSVEWKIFPHEDFRVRRFPYVGPHNIRTLPPDAGIAPLLRPQVFLWRGHPSSDVSAYQCVDDQIDSIMFAMSDRATNNQ